SRSAPASPWPQPPSPWPYACAAAVKREAPARAGALGRPPALRSEAERIVHAEVRLLEGRHARPPNGRRDAALDRAREGAVDLRVGRAAGVAGEAHADDRRAARAVAASADRALDAVHRAHDVGAAGGLRSAARAATAAARRRLSTRAASP